MRPSESIRSRILTRFSSGVLTGVATLLQQGILARGLGSAGVGILGFLQSFFLNAFSFFDLPASEAFVNRTTQDPGRYPGNVFIYAVTVGATALLIGTAVAITQGLGFSGSVWPAVPPSLVWLGTLLGISQFLMMAGTRICDAAGVSRLMEIGRKLRAILLLLFLWGAMRAGYLTLPVCLWALLISFVFFASWSWWVGHHAFGLTAPVSYLEVAKREWPHFRAYMKPLFFTTFIAGFNGVFERWLLQMLGGASEQGYFTLSTQAAAALLLPAGTVLPVFQREFGIAFGKNDVAGGRKTYLELSQVLFLIAVLPAVFLSVNAQDLTVLFGGRDFSGARWTMAVMCLYPVHQSVNQMALNFLLATSQVQRYLNIRIFIEALSLVLVYFFLAPRDWAVPGLQLAGAGLALKFIVLQTVYYYLMELSIFPDRRKRLLSLVLRDTLSFGSLGLLAYGAKACATMWAPSSFAANPLLMILTSGAFYALGALIFTAAYFRANGMPSPLHYLRMLRG